MKKTSLFMCMAILCSSVGFAADFMPQKEQFAAFSADPTQPAFGVRLTGIVGGSQRTEINMGDEVGLVRWDLNGGRKLQFGIMGGVAARFDTSRVTNDFQVADFSVAFPLDYATDKWGLRAMYWHTSSHVGDDYIMSNNLSPAFLEKHVTDDLRLTGDYRPVEGVRLYGGLYYAFNIIPHTSDRWHGQAGAEAELRRDSHAWFLCGDLRAHARYGWQPSFNSRAGWKYYGGAGNLSLFGEFFTGHLPYLAFETEKETHWSFGFSVEM